MQEAAAFALAALTATGLLAVLARVLPPAFLATSKPTPDRLAYKRQIGGLALGPAFLVGLAAAAFLAPEFSMRYALLALAVALLAAVGLVDDRRGLPVSVRLAAEFAASALVLWAFWPIRPFGALLPDWIALPLLFCALVWFINLTNFMDGADLLVAANAGLPLTFIAALSGYGLLAQEAGLIAAAAGGALIAFMRVNWPPAHIILGDSGSLPFGLIAGIVALRLTETAPQIFALLPLSFLVVDSTSTLLYRTVTGKRIFEGHTTHAYQVASKAGVGKVHIIAVLSAWMLLTSLLALLAFARPTPVVEISVALHGLAGVALVIAYLRTRKATAR